MSITKSSLETELQITFAAGYTDAFFTTLCTWAENYLKMKTYRTAFSGATSTIADYAMTCIAIDRLATSNRDIIKSAISSISENGASISFSNHKNLASYREEFNQAVADLKLPFTSNHSIIFPDLNNDHTGLETSILY